MDRELCRFSGNIVITEFLNKNVLAKHFVDSGNIVMSCLNPYSCWLALFDPEFRRSLAASICICDGKWLSLALKFRRRGVACNTGSDFFETVCQNAVSLGIEKMFFIGGTEQSLADLKQNLKKKFPEVEIVGSFSPPFSTKFDAELFSELGDLVNSTDADVVWIGLGAPKQEKFATSLLQHCSPSLVGCVGAVFDFQSGNIERAPWLLRKIGLEWFHRLVLNPKRIWPRIVPSFLIVIGVIFGVLR